jgi:hypothetical protein
MTTAAPIEAIMKLFDSYSRVARLYPSLVALAPIIWSAVALFPSIIENTSRGAAFVTAAAAVLYFLTSIARSLGKRAEIKLLRRWGGWPTTILLRHQDSGIDRVTKERYHRALERMSGLKLATPEEEQRDLVQADDLYRSATRKLIEQRRDPKYHLIHGENASYGFRRNLYGLKPVAIVETLIVIFATALGWWLITPQPYTLPVVIQTTINYPHFLLLLLLDLSYFLLWIWAVTPNFVYQAGREYGEALLRTLDA